MGPSLGREARQIHGARHDVHDEQAVAGDPPNQVRDLNGGVIDRRQARPVAFEEGPSIAALPAPGRRLDAVASEGVGDGGTTGLIFGDADLTDAVQDIGVARVRGLQDQAHDDGSPSCEGRSKRLPLVAA